MNRMFFAQNVSATTPPITGLGYGRLYNGYAASDSRLAPSGWHVPTYSDLDILISFITYNNSGYVLKETGIIHWDSPNYANNATGFSLLGSGYRQYFGAFENLNIHGTVCSSEYYSSSNYFLLAENSKYTAPISGWGLNGRTFGMSVRLLKNDSVNVDTLTDYDGNVYNTVTIGTQVWTASNWKCTKYNDGTSIPNVTSDSAWAALTTGAMCAYNNDENNV